MANQLINYADKIIGILPEYGEYLEFKEILSRLKEQNIILKPDELQSILDKMVEENMIHQGSITCSDGNKNINAYTKKGVIKLPPNVPH